MYCDVTQMTGVLRLDYVIAELRPKSRSLAPLHLHLDWSLTGPRALIALIFVFQALCACTSILTTCSANCAAFFHIVHVYKQDDVDTGPMSHMQKGLLYCNVLGILRRSDKHAG